MQITVQGKQIDVGEALRVHVNDKITEIDAKYFNHATDGTVTFSREGHGHGLIKCHISIRVGKNIHVVADAAENDPYLSFDVASAKVAKQLRRYKRRLRDHNERMERVPETDFMEARDYTISGDQADDHAEEAPVVIAEMTTNVATLSVSDAVMRMDLSNQPVLLFRNAKHGDLNIVYRRPDGNVGWIDPANIAAKVQAAE